MNRKMQNATSALIATAGLLVLGLAFALPAPYQPQPRSVTLPIDLGIVQVELTKTLPTETDAARQARIESVARSIEQRITQVDSFADGISLAADTVTLAALASVSKTASAQEAPTRPARKARRNHRRHPLAMPYFSFAPRGSSL